MFVQRLKNLSDRTPSEDEPVLDTFAEVQQRWHLWRRRYDLFIRHGPKRILSLVSDPQPEPEPESYHQYAKIDERFLAWDFMLRDAHGKEMASVSRAFRGFGREVCRRTLHLDSQVHLRRFSPIPVWRSPHLARAPADEPVNKGDILLGSRRQNDR